MEKKFRIQLTERELRGIRNLLAEHYRQNRRNLRYSRKRIAKGEQDSRTYPINEREKHLKKDARLLKKLSRHIPDVKWFEL